MITHTHIFFSQEAEAVVITTENPVMVPGIDLGQLFDQVMNESGNE
jgi:hypothetical protein